MLWSPPRPPLRTETLVGPGIIPSQESLPHPVISAPWKQALLVHVEVPTPQFKTTLQGQLSSRAPVGLAEAAAVTASEFSVSLYLVLHSSFPASAVPKSPPH